MKNKTSQRFPPPPMAQQERESHDLPYRPGDNVQFHYRKAWREWAKPESDSLGGDMHRLLEYVYLLANQMHQRGDLGVSFPDSPDGAYLRMTMSRYSSYTLCRAACVIFWYGHWAYRGSQGMVTQVAGAYWKFGKLVDEITLARGEMINGYRWCQETYNKLYWNPKYDAKTCMEYDSVIRAEEDADAASRQAARDRLAKGYTCPDTTEFKPEPFYVGRRRSELVQVSNQPWRQLPAVPAYLRPNADRIVPGSPFTHYVDVVVVDGVRRVRLTDFAGGWPERQTGDKLEVRTVRATVTEPEHEPQKGQHVDHPRKATAWHDTELADLRRDARRAERYLDRLRR